MKKVIFILLVFIMTIIISCIDDPFKHCTNNYYPRYCEDYNSCCPVLYPYNCNGICYSDEYSAWDSCGRFGWWIDYCYYE